MGKVTIHSALTGRPFQVVLENYPYNELPRLSDTDIQDLRLAADLRELSDLELSLLRAEQRRAHLKVIHCTS